MDQQEKESLEAAAVRFMKEPGNISFELDRTLTVGLIGQLQLAFRHPANTGPTRETMEKFVRELIDRLDPSFGGLHQFLSLGFDPAFDEQYP